ncbi:MAG: hypothetical protein JL50_06785 [Peptococcaceae bacterium BICA1-7]|nr:MAG: hypothetical protein JL50_06785 [Peptococcaceae bacterium BICA1-7]HBV99227.1 hypothetical protein [Desulfotomaculum sp.]
MKLFFNKFFKLFCAVLIISTLVTSNADASATYTITNVPSVFPGSWFQESSSFTSIIADIPAGGLVNESRFDVRLPADAACVLSAEIPQEIYSVTNQVYSVNIMPLTGLKTTPAGADAYNCYSVEVKPFAGTNNPAKLVLKLSSLYVPETITGDLDVIITSQTGDFPSGSLVIAQVAEPTAIIYTSPANGEEDVSVNNQVFIKFNYPVEPGDNYDGIEITPEGGLPLTAFGKSIDGRQLTLSPDLQYETTYRVDIPAGAFKDYSGFFPKNDFAFSFKTIQDKPAQTIILYVGKKEYQVDGYTFVMDMSSFRENGQMFTPVRYLAECFGAMEIMWDAHSQIITFEKKGKIVKMQIGSTSIYINDRIMDTGVAPVIRDGRTLIPVRFVAELFGYKVTEDSSKIVLNYDPSSVNDGSNLPVYNGPRILGTDPVNYSENMVIGRIIKLTFDKNIYEGGSFSQITVKKADGGVIPYTASITGNTLALNLNTDLSPGCYIVEIPTGAVKDGEGTALAGSYLLNFTCYLQKSPPTTIVYCVGKSEIKVEGNSIVLDAPAVYQDGHVYVPLRAILTPLSMPASWDANTQTIILQKNDRTVKMKVGEGTLYIDDRPFVIGAAPFISNGRTYVPVKLATEAFGYKVVEDSGGATLTYVRPVFISAVANTAGNIITVTFSKEMRNNPGMHVQFRVEVNGAECPVVSAALNADPAKIDLFLSNPVSKGQNVTLSYTAGSVAAIDSSLLAALDRKTVVVPAAITTTEVQVDNTNKNLAITDSTVAAAGGNPVVITIPSSVRDATISVAERLVASAGNLTSVLPPLQISSYTGISPTEPVLVEIPGNTTVSAPLGWDGTISVPAVKENNSVTVNPSPGKRASVGTVIEVGFGDVPLTFNKAVRMLIPGQAGKEVGYYRNGFFTKISRICAEDSQIWADHNANIPAGEDGRIDVNNDLVIWTKHFTRFVTYTETDTTSGGGGVGGGGGGPTPSKPVNSTSGAATVTPVAGGTVGLGSEAMVTIPAKALQGNEKAEVAVRKEQSTPDIAQGFKVLGAVYNFTVNGQDNYEFNKPVTLTFTFEPAELPPGQLPVVHYYDEAAGQWVNLGGTVSGNTITVTVGHFTRFAVLAVKEAVKPPVQKPSMTLTDISGQWAEANIIKLAGLGAISGYPDGTFKPDNAITRAEFAVVLLKALKLEARQGKVFSDTAGHWARDAISTAAANGIISGYSDNSFGPDDPVTREQMAVMVGKAAGLSTPLSQGTDFKDGSEISSWAVGPVAVAVLNGVIKGYPDGTFRPLAGTTRAEAVTVIVNAMKK